MQKKLLYYGFNEERREKVVNVAEKFGIKTKEVKREDLEQKVAVLFNLEGYEREDLDYVEVPETEMLLFGEFDRTILQSYLMELKEKDVIVPHKAVITETSKDWKFSYLVEHIQEEHKVVQMFNELGKLTKIAQKKLDTVKDVELIEAVDYALSIREINGVEMEDIMPRYNRLKEALNG